MKLSRQWLNEITPIRKNDTEVAEIFTQLGFECERIDPIGVGLENIVTAKIINIRRHPNADKLQLATVTDGKDKLEVVCGAPNIAVGQIVPLARMGIILPGGQKIERVKIRGIESCGMLCSGRELGLNDDHSGIWQIDPIIKPGTPLSLVLGLPDTVFDLNVPPNRPDCLSVVGLAQEYAAQTGLKLELPLEALKQASIATIRSVSASVSAKKACSYYAVRYLSDVKVESSPWWLQKRLIAGGIRPINSVVDATNYILLLTGQPLHAFDADKVVAFKGIKKINVRQAKPGEIIELLDGTKKSLTPDVTVISDSSHALAVAGIMGGSNSAVTTQTKNIIIEAALFDPKAIRRSSQRLGVRTESSSRFEKGIDSTSTDTALDAATSLISAISNGVVHRGIVYGAKAKAVKKIVRYTADEVNGLLGMDITVANQIKILKSIGCRVAKAGQLLVVAVPSWRIDLSHMADLAEEIGRHAGYYKITPDYLTSEIKPLTDQTDLAKSRPIKQQLVKMGMSEMYNYSFYGPELAVAAISQHQLKDHYALANPLNPDQTYLRTSLVPRLLDNIRHNQSQQNAIKMFEVGRVFSSGKSKPSEITMVAGVVSYKGKDRIDAFLEIKGIVEQLLNHKIDFVPSKENLLIYQIKGIEGYIRTYPSMVTKSLKISDGTVSFELPIDDLASRKDTKRYHSFSIYPEVERDFSVILNETNTFAEAEQLIHDINVPTITEHEPNGLIKSIDYANIYRGDRIGRGKKNLTIHVVFQSDHRTLVGAEVEKIAKDIITRLKTTLGVEIRSDSNPK